MDAPIGFLHTDISMKITLALGVGLLVGLEREFASKDIGVRTFAITGLFGLVSVLIGDAFATAGFIGVLCLAITINVRALLVNRSLEITTSFALLVVYCLGALVGKSHVFTPVASAILMTMLLTWKTEIARFSQGLSIQEIRSAVVLGLLSFVIYPVLPDNYIDPWQLMNPKEAWITVIVLAGISFVNYILLKVYRTKGLFYSALLGGAVNSSATVTEISAAVKLHGGGVLPQAISFLLMTTIAMFVRNLFLLGVFEPTAILIASAPLVGMTLAAIFYVWRSGNDPSKKGPHASPIQVTSPVSIMRVLKFAIVFILLEAAGTLAQRYLGSVGVLSVSFLGGFVSSASTTAAAAKLASQGKITATVAGVATILASISSAFVNLPIVYQITKNRALVRNLAFATSFCVLSGLLLMVIVTWLQHLIHWPT